MNTLVNISEAKAVNVRIEAQMFYIQLEDGRELGVPYGWFWRLEQASESQRKNWRFIAGGAGIHWEEIDEDISIKGVLLGQKNPTPPVAG